MSNKIFYLFAMALITLMSFSAATFAGVIEVQDDPGVETGWGSDDTGGGAGSKAVYIRTDIDCTNSDKQKTTCRARGDELCTDQYCI